jgi:hypothetical protein
MFPEEGEEEQLTDVNWRELVDKTIKQLDEQYLGKKFVQKQRRYMNRHLYKPKGMTAKEFLDRLNELNGYLRLLGGITFDEAELVEIFRNAMPKPWKAMLIE